MSDENKNENRTLVISNFRNLGPFCSGKGKENNDDREFLKINRSLEPDYLGGLVLLIGVNNCGKTNVLDALEKYKTHNFTESDYTDFTYADRIKPTIGMNIANGAYSEDDLIPKPSNVTYSGPWGETLITFLLENENFELAIMNGLLDPSSTYENYADLVTGYVKSWTIANRYHEGVNFIKTILIKRQNVVIKNIRIDGKGDIGSIEMKGTECIGVLAFSGHGFEIYSPIQILSNGNPDSYKILEVGKKSATGVTAGSINNPVLSAIYPIIDKVTIEKQIDKDESNFFKRYGYYLSNRIFKYTPEKIKQSDLLCKPAEPNAFFMKVLRSIDLDIGAIKQAYSGTKNLRIKLEKDMNRELKKVSDELNNLLNINEKKYTLSVNLERNDIEFIITYGDDVPLNLDRQSEGFRWLFDLFFNMLKTQDFQPGDMILIDEFGNSLGFSTVGELAATLREYGQKLGITFVIATQNPMAVDITHLDEIRLIIPQDNGSAHIVNQFDYFGNFGEHDSVGPVVNGLMVSRNYMRTENRRTIFVEGAMDYFYLNAFAQMMRKEGTEVDVDFIPMNGLGSRDDKPEELLNQIGSIERYPIILVDSDGKGSQVYKKAKSMKITVSSIGEIFDDKKKEIEDLFSKSDAAKFNVNEKSFDTAACFAQGLHRMYKDIDAETKENFKTLIDYVMTI